MERITCNLNKQLQALLHNAFFTDSMMADKLLQRQRTEVEDELEGLNNIGCDEVILKGVMLTEVPNVANPMTHILKSLNNKLDDPGEVSRVDSSKRTHKVLVGDNLLNEYEDNPELIGGAFATLFPLGLTKDDLGKGGPMHPKLVRTWLMSHDRRFAKHRSFNHFLFNQKIRHDTNLKVSIRVKADDNRTRKLTTLVNAADFLE